MIFALIMAVAACAAWSLWVRRSTWRYPWESAATTSVALLGTAALLLSTPTAATLGPALHALTGQWYLDDSLGHACLIGAAAAMAQNALIRSTDLRSAQAVHKQWVEFPATLSLPLLLATFTLSEVPDAQHRAADYFIEVPVDFWLTAHSLIWCALMIYLMAFTIHKLLIVRQDERSRRTADIYIVSVALGILVCAARIATVLHPPLLTVELVTLGALCACASVCGAGVAAAAGQSWRAKMRPFR